MTGFIEKAPRRVNGSLLPRNVVDIASVAAHYDRLDKLVRLSVDPQTYMYTCAIWRPGTETLAEAQIAKVDHTLAKLELRPNQLLLDIGSGYGFVLRRAQELYGVRGIGLNLSQAQVEYSNQTVQGNAGIEYRLQGWEEFDGKVDAIVTIGAFEQFGRAMYPKFFQDTRQMLPKGGLMLLHTIEFDQLPDRKTDREKARRFVNYARFINKDIFPNGELPYPGDVVKNASEHGFSLVNTEELRNTSGEPYYARTLDAWAENLLANKDEALKITDQETYDMFMDYLERSAYWFRERASVVRQHLLKAA